MSSYLGKTLECHANVGITNRGSGGSKPDLIGACKSSYNQVIVCEEEEILRQGRTAQPIALHRVHLIGREPQ